ncbi:p53-like transcription factor [Mucor lusitanicus]
MSDNVMITPLFHQRSHSMPVGRTFINGNPVITHGNGVVVEGGAPRTFDYKRSSPLKQEATSHTISSSNQLTTSEGFPLPIPKSLTSQFRASPLNQSAAAATHRSEPRDAEDDHADDEQEDPAFFCQPRNLLALFDYHKKTGSCPVILNCKMDRGFFVSQSHWTCYRRNYFQVTASLTIPGHSDQTYYALQLRSAENRPIQQFFLRLKACTSTTSNTGESSNESSNTATVRPVALTQMTPKRDKGPQREPPTIPITPSDSVFGNEQVCVTFERLQFRVATANNGKLFRLVFELVAQLDDASQHVVAECYSSPLVVRGRSPGHYSSDPQRDVRKKRKLTPPPPPPPSSSTRSKKQATKEASCSPKKPSSCLDHTATTPPTPPSAVVGAATAAAVPQPQQQQQHYQHVVTLPPPQYVYNPPSLVVDTQRQPSNDNTSSSSSVPTSANSPVSYHAQQQQQQQQPLMPHLMTSAFNNMHARSQSANDSEMYARHRQGFKYLVNQHHQQQQNTAMFDNYSEANIETALRDWQQQVHRQRADSAATFDSYMSSSNEHDNRSSTRPGTPIPYHAQQQQQQQQQYYSQPPNSNWSPAAVHHPPPAPPLGRHHYEEKYHPQQPQQELSPKLYQQSR